MTSPVLTDTEFERISTKERSVWHAVEMSRVLDSHEEWKRRALEAEAAKERLAQELLDLRDHPVFEIVETSDIFEEGAGNDEASE